MLPPNLAERALAKGTVMSCFFFFFVFVFVFFFAPKEAYPIVGQLEKITVKKAQVKIVNARKTNVGSLEIPTPGHLSVIKGNIILVWVTKQILQIYIFLFVQKRLLFIVSDLINVFMCFS